MSEQGEVILSSLRAAGVVITDKEAAEAVEAGAQAVQNPGAIAAAAHRVEAAVGGNPEVTPQQSGEPNETA